MPEFEIFLFTVFEQPKLRDVIISAIKQSRFLKIIIYQAEILLGVVKLSRVFIQKSLLLRGGLNERMSYFRGRCNVGFTVYYT